MKDKSLNGKQIFKLAYGGNKNACSDNILKYGKIGLNRAYELSFGFGNLYGVSIVDLKRDKAEGNTDLFKTFESIKEAETYILKLKDDYKKERETIKEKEKTIREEDIKKPIKEELINLIKKSNKKVYCILKGVSFNGMNRKISFFIVVENEPLNINNYILKLLNYNGNYNYLNINGCGMDMGFSVVSNLSEELYKDYKVLKSEWV